MEKVSAYRIVRNRNTDPLVEEINELIKSGWIPWGILTKGPVNRSTDQYVQAMVRPVGGLEPVKVGKGGK